MLDLVRPTPAERSSALPGDDLVEPADVVMDRAFSLSSSRARVWPWLVQLGKGRAGWYLPRPVEALIPRARRGARRIDQRWQDLSVGDVIPDYGGRNETFEVALIDPPKTLVYRSTRGAMHVSWAITLAELSSTTTRVHLRLRLGSVRRPLLARTGGEAIDVLTIAGLAAGLIERLAADSLPGRVT